MTPGARDRPAADEGSEKVARILLVGDVRRLVELLKNYLRRTTCRILTSRVGEETLAACRRERPDVVFLDASLEDPGGVEACRALKSEPMLRSIPVVLVASRDMIDRCLGAGCDDVLPKPVVQEEFLSRVRRFVALRERGEGRIPVSLRVEYRSPAGDRAAYTKDLSPRGAFIKTIEPLPVGSRLRVTIHLPKGRPPLNLRAEVMRIVRRPAAHSHLLPGMGVRFVDPPASDRRALEEFIEERRAG